MARRAGRAVLLAAVLVVSIAAGSVALAVSAAASPAGFVTVDDSQVYSDLPEQTPMGQSAQEIADAGVMSSAHADSLEVIVTSPGRAKNKIDGGEIHGSGPISIVLTDDENSEGRTVALPAAEVRDALGFAPQMARGTHEDGSPWNEEIEYQDGWMLVDVPHFSTNTVSFAGQVQIGDTFTDGSQVQYDLNDLDSASDPVVNLTGKLSTEVETATGAGVGLDHTTPISLNGNGPINGTGDPTLSVTGHVTEASYNPIDAEVGGTVDVGRDFIGDDGGDNTYSAEVKVQPQNAGIPDNITVIVDGTSGTDYVSNVDIYIQQKDSVDVEFSGRGTLIKSGWDPAWETGPQTIPLSTNYELQANTNYTITFINNDGSDGDGTEDMIKIGYNYTEIDSTDWYAKSVGTPHPGPADLTINTVGQVNNLDASDDSGNSVSIGNLSDNETKTTTLGLTTSSSQLNFTGSGGGLIDYTLTYEERTQTEDPGVVLNGNETVEHTGTLADGETTQLTLSKETLQSGTNTVNVSMPELSADAPPMQVGVEYSHDAQDDQTVDYEAEKFSERYNVSKTYASDRKDPTLTIPFADTAVSIRDAEYRLNGGDWTDADGWVLSNTTGTIHLPDVQAEDSIDVRANASKVAVSDGTIKVLEATPTADKLDTKIKITEHRPDFAIDVSGIDDDRLVFATDESWSEPDAHAYVDASGNQELRLPEAGVGSTARIQDVPIWATPDNDVEVVIQDAATPRFQLRPGDTEGDLVEIEYRDTVSGQAYELRDITNDRPADTDTAESPVYFSTDDSLITYEIVETTLDGSNQPVAVGVDDTSGGIPTWLIVLGAVLVGILALWGVNRKWGTGPSDGWFPSRLVMIGGAVLGIIGVELVTPESALGSVTSSVLESGFGAMLAAVALIVGVLYVDQRTDIEVPMPAYVGVAGLVLVFVFQSLSGPLVDALAVGLEEVGPLIWLGLIGGGAALIYLWIRAERQPDTRVTFDLGRRGN